MVHHPKIRRRTPPPPLDLNSCLYLLQMIAVKPMLYNSSCTICSYILRMSKCYTWLSYIVITSDINFVLYVVNHTLTSLTALSTFVTEGYFRNISGNRFPLYVFISIILYVLYKQQLNLSFQCHKIIVYGRLDVI